MDQILRAEDTISHTLRIIRQTQTCLHHNYL
nr:MAG TPA: hypothetical protein [Caudoviricetes sp.]DAN12536.1 MAG TPA: hypothetical protein [Bacteriophage sp.]